MAVDGQFGETLYPLMVSICFLCIMFLWVFSPFPTPHQVKTQYIFLYLFLTTDGEKRVKRRYQRIT